MAEIVQSVVGDQALRLYNEQYGRKMGIGCAWGKIRVLMRYTTVATSNINSSGIVLGVSQGTTDMFRSSNTTDFAGAVFTPASPLQGANWTYNAASTPYASLGGTFPVAVRRTGNTNTVVAPGGSATFYHAIAPTHGVFAVDIEKAYGALKIKPLGCGSLPLAQTDFNIGNFFFNADNDVATTGLIGHSPNIITVPYTGNYAFDSVNVDWNNGIQPLEISDLLVLRFY